MKSPRSGGFAHIIILLIIAAIVIGGAATFMSGDLAYSAQSLLAAATGAIDTTPRVDITRETSYVTSDFWSSSTSSNTIAVFNIAPKNVKTTTYVSNIAVSYKVDTTAPTSLQRNGFYMGYQSCPTPSSCVWTSVPVGSVIKSGSTYVVTTASNAKIAVPAGQSVRLYVNSTNYYGVTYNLSTAVNVGVSAALGGQIKAVTDTGTVLPVNSTLAYGAVLKVRHGYGYGYGYNDYSDDGKLDYADISILKDVVKGVRNCFVYKICDVNTDGRVTDNDVQIVTQRAGTNATPPVPTIAVSQVGATAAVAVGNVGNYTIPFTVTAGDNDIYIAKPGWATTPTSNPIGDTAADSFTSATTETLDRAGVYHVKAHTSRQFTLNVSYKVARSGYLGVMIPAISYGLTSSLGSTYLPDVKIFKTQDLYIDYVATVTPITLPLTVSTTQVNDSIVRAPSATGLSFGPGFSLTSTDSSAQGWQLINNQDGTYTPAGSTVSQSSPVQGFGFYESSGGIVAGRTVGVRSYVSNNKPAGTYTGSYKLQEIGANSSYTTVATIAYRLVVK